MRALVTGANGFAGRHLVGLLRARGHEVVAAGHGAEEEVDFREPEEVEWICAQARPEVIFHLAGTSSLADMRRDPTGGNLNIVKPATNLLDELLHRHRSTRMVVVSTCHVYGRPTRLPMDEAHPMAPVDLYGAARAAVEHILKSYLNFGLDLVVARAFHHTGPGQDRRFAIPDWIAQHLAAPGRAVRVGNLDLRRDYCDVRDVVAGYLLLAERGQRGQAYNLCAGQALPLRTLFELACPGATADVDAARLRTADVPVLWGDPSRAEALGWVRRYEPMQTVTDLRRSMDGGAG